MSKCEVSSICGLEFLLESAVDNELLSWKVPKVMGYLYKVEKWMLEVYLDQLKFWARLTLNLKILCGPAPVIFQ